MQGIRYSLFCLIFTALLHPISAAQTTELNTLDVLRWHKRIILLNLPERDESILSQLMAAELEIEERHIEWFMIHPNGVETNAESTLSLLLVTEIQSTYFEDPSKQVVLIGKDGGLKGRSKTLQLKDLFDRIDSMPMRQQEMLR